MTNITWPSNLQQLEPVQQSVKHEDLIIPVEKFFEGYFYDVSGYIEKKQNLEYLSWSYAYMLLKQLDPTLFIGFKEDLDNKGQPYIIPADPGENAFSYYTMPYLYSGNKKTPALFYPVLNHSNRPAPTVDCASYNKSRMRGAVKVIAMYTGIGLTLFTREHDNDDSDFSEKVLFIQGITKMTSSRGGMSILPKDLQPTKALSSYTMEELKAYGITLKQFYIDKKKQEDESSKSVELSKSTTETKKEVAQLPG